MKLKVTQGAFHFLSAKNWESGPLHPYYESCDSEQREDEELGDELAKERPV